MHDQGQGRLESFGVCDRRGQSCVIHTVINADVTRGGKVGILDQDVQSVEGLVRLARRENIVVRRYSVVDPLREMTVCR